MRVAAILHPYCPDTLIEPFRSAGVNVFRGGDLERNDLPDAAIVFGGDGSMHRVLGAVAETGCPVLPVPMGSGNDYAHTLGLRSVADAVAAWKSFVATGRTRAVDLGVIERLMTADANREGARDPQTWTFADEDGRILAPEKKLAPKIMQSQLRHVDETEAAAKTYFCNIAGVGLDGLATEIANGMPKWLRRRGGYSLAAARALLKYRPQRVQVAVEAAQTFEGPALLAAFGVAATYGGGMRMLPKAKLDDGLLDVCFVDAVPKLTVLRHFQKIFSGRHLSLPVVHYTQGRRVRVDSAEPLRIYADGESVGATPVEVRVVEKALTLVVPG